MLDLGLDVLFKGKNLARLLGGLGVALKISATSVLIRLQFMEANSWNFFPSSE